MAISTPKVPKPSDPQLVRRSQHSAREAWRMFEIIAEFVTATERLPAIQPAAWVGWNVKLWAPPRTPIEYIAWNA